MKIIVHEPLSPQGRTQFFWDCLNHPDDLYLYFEGGEAIWNRTTSNLTIQLGDPSNLITLDKGLSIREAMRRLDTAMWHLKGFSTKEIHDKIRYWDRIGRLDRERKAARRFWYANGEYVHQRYALHINRSRAGVDCEPQLSHDLTMTGHWVQVRNLPISPNGQRGLPALALPWDKIPAQKNLTTHQR